MQDGRHTIVTNSVFYKSRDDEDSPPRYELPVVPEDYVMDEETATNFLACNDRSDLKKLLANLKEKSLNMTLLLLLHLSLLLIRIMISLSILS